MKQLVLEIYRGYELKSYEHYINGNRSVIAYAYKLGKSINKKDYEFETQAKNKTYALINLKKMINQKLKPIDNRDINESLLNKYSNTIYKQDNNLYLRHIDDFNWLRKQVKRDYGVNIKLEDNKITF